MAVGREAFHQRIGIEFVAVHDDGVTMQLHASRRHLNEAGAVHSGVLFTLADSALGHGISRAVGKPCTTAEMKVCYLSPAPPGILTARSRILRAGRRLVVARAEVCHGNERVAEALATFAVLG
ncbi:MAG: PaaI family thioesterase [Bryobacterales bacterium]|nr:PaaI family thioesterase [Bryobacterales bacterium]